MRNSGNFMWGFIPRVIVGLVLAITVCANANAGAVAVLCADQEKCKKVEVKEGSCNYFTTGQYKSVGECATGYWYCLDDENGECVTFNCHACTKGYGLVSVNDMFGGVCEYTLYDVNRNELLTNGDACMEGAEGVCPPSYCNMEDPIYGDKLDYPSCMDVEPNEYNFSPYINGFPGSRGCYIPQGIELGDESGTFTYDEDCYFKE